MGVCILGIKSSYRMVFSPSHDFAMSMCLSTVGNFIYRILGEQNEFSKLVNVLDLGVLKA